MTDTFDYAVSINVFTPNQTDVARACEVLGRAVAGLALDGIDANLSVHRLYEEDDDA